MEVKLLLLALVALVTIPRYTVAQNGQVIGLELIQGGSSTVVASLIDGAIITIPFGTTPNFGVKAVTSGFPISSVIFGWNDVAQYRVESSAPYALCGNDGPMFFRCSRLLIGTHKVTATISNTGSTISATFQIVYNAIPPTAPVSSPMLPPPTLKPLSTPPNMTFYLIYTPNNTEVMELRTGSVVDLARFPTPAFNIRAETNDPTVKSVRFLPANQAETSRPFAYCGNSGPLYFTCPSFASLGLFNITVEPFTERYQAGQELPNVVLSFTIRQGLLTLPPAPVSVPVPPPIVTPTVFVSPVLPMTKTPLKSPTSRSSTRMPSKGPTKRPTASPIRLLTKSPTRMPSQGPTKRPTASPMRLLTKSPTRVPSNRPTKRPSASPIRLPTKSPTRLPSKNPTLVPTTLPTDMLSVVPTESVTIRPTMQPTRLPTLVPTKRPTARPTKTPTRVPILAPEASVPIFVPVARDNITLTLVYTPDNTDVVRLVDGMIINASKFENLSFNIRADSISTNVQSIQFFPINRGETSKPWAYCGNVGPLYTTCEEFTSRGNFTVTARPYSGTGQTGTQYTDVTIRFSIVGATTPSAGFPIRINCGGTTVIDSKGQRWSADSYFSGGATYSTSAVEILNTEDDILYQSERWGTFIYNIPVPLGSYSVILHFAEILYVLLANQATCILISFMIDF